jgi:hypothetical protein
MHFAVPLKKKGAEDVFPAIRRFVSMVKVKYGLDVCKIRHNNDTSVISAHSSTGYQVWCEECSIEIEPTPTNTHEPNGGSERAGQEIITKSVKMRTSAGLPERLWPYTSTAAVYLFNRSPQQGRA